MKYQTTAYLKSGPITNTVEAPGFFEAIKTERKRLIDEQLAKIYRDEIWSAKIVAVRMEDEE